MKTKISLDLSEATQALKYAPDFGIDTETMGFKLHRDKIVGISLWALKKGFYIPLRHNCVGAKNYSVEEVRDALNPYLSDPHKTAIYHNAVFDINMLRADGFQTDNQVMDTMIAGYLIDENFKEMGLDHKLKTLTPHYLKIRQPTFKETTGGLPIATLKVGKAAYYAVADAFCTHRLMHHFIPILKEQGLWKLFTEIEMPLIKITAGMIYEGIGIDKAYLESLKPDYEFEMRRLEDEIYTIAGFRFNIGSSEQLKDALQKVIGLRPQKVHKKALKRIEDSHPIIPMIQEYRKLKSYYGKYVIQFIKNVNPVSNRIHANMVPMTVSGRYFCKNPNIQALPKTSKGDPHYFDIRKAIISRPGMKLVVADFSQVELRVMAYYSREPDFLNAYCGDKEDIHLKTAKTLLGVPADGTKEQYGDERDKAKTLNFSTMYGASYRSIKYQLDISFDEAKKICGDYRTTYTALWKFIDKIHEKIQFSGEVTNIFGRTRRIPGIWHLGQGGIVKIFYEAHGEKGSFKAYTNKLFRWCANTVLFKGWDRKSGKLIFKNQENVYYRNNNFKLLDDEGKMGKIPEKNFSYKRIRAIQIGPYFIAFTTMEEAFRKGFSFLIQSTATEICKLAMIRIWDKLPEYGAKLILQVHDELVFECPEERVEEFRKVVKETMEMPPTAGWEDFMEKNKHAEWDIPLVVDVKPGDNYSEAK